jgi:hypothetical protein
MTKIKGTSKKDIADLNIGEFTKEHSRLKKMIKRDDLNSAAAGQQLTRTLLAMAIEMLPKVEKTFNKSQGGRGIYAVVTLSNLIRELVNDLRSMSDHSELVDRIMTNCIDLNLSVLATASHNSIASINAALKEKTKKTVTLNINGS